MEGFYDVVAVAFGSVGVMLYRRQNYAFSSLAWGLAVFIHPRLLALLPVGMLAAYASVRRWSTLRWHERLALVLGTFAAIGALAFAIWIQPTVRLHALAQPNLVNVLRIGTHPTFVSAIFAIVLVFFAFILWRKDHRADAAIALFCGLAFSSQRYLTPWYWLLVLPWAVGPALSAASSSRLVGWAKVYLTTAFLVASLASKW
jgi:hypothetical protein